MKLAALLIFAALSAQAADDAKSSLPRVPIGSAGRTAPVNQMTPQQRQAQDNEIKRRMPWLDKTKYQDCGMSCLYEKGNENLSLQTMYIIDKLADLKKEKNNDAEVFKRLGIYCALSEKNSGDSASCLRRYGREQIVILRKIRLAIARNSANAGKYKSGPELDNKSEAPIFSMLRDPDSNAPKKAQTPYVPRFSDLIKEYETDTALLQDLVGEDYRQWDATRMAQPNPEDFYVMTQVDRDPGNPKSGKMTVIKTDAMGRQVKDMEAYRMAVDRWELASKDPSLKREMATTKDIIKTNPEWKDRGSEVIASAQANKGTFAFSRTTVIDVANKQTKEAGIQSKSEASFPGKTGEGRAELRQRSVSSAPPIAPDAAEMLAAPVKPVANQDQFFTLSFQPSSIDDIITKLEGDPDFN